MVINPPSGGPIIGPSSAGTVSQLSARTSCALGMLRRMTSRPTGTIIAPPMPCRKRAATSAPSESDVAQPIEPSRNTPIATMKVGRAPKRSATQPLIGMNTASASMYVVRASFSATGSTPKSSAIAGSEVAIAVESMFSMNNAVATISGNRRSRFTVRAGAYPGRRRHCRPRGVSGPARMRCAMPQSSASPCSGRRAANHANTAAVKNISRL